MRAIQTEKAAKPFSRYSQAVAIEAGQRLIFISGQVGVSATGELAPTEEAQHETAWRNIFGILQSEGLDAHALVDVTAYLTDPSGLPVYRGVRDRVLAGATPASTLIIVSALADPRWKVEISAVAAA